MFRKIDFKWKNENNKESATNDFFFSNLKYDCDNISVTNNMYTNDERIFVLKCYNHIPVTTISFVPAVSL